MITASKAFKLAMNNRVAIQKTLVETSIADAITQGLMSVSITIPSLCDSVYEELITNGYCVTKLSSDIIVSWRYSNNERLVPKV